MVDSCNEEFDIVEGELGILALFEIDQRLVDQLRYVGLVDESKSRWSVVDRDGATTWSCKQGRLNLLTVRVRVADRC